jgi:hypothetical protein
VASLKRTTSGRALFAFGLSMACAEETIVAFDQYRVATVVLTCVATIALVAWMLNIKATANAVILIVLLFIGAFAEDRLLAAHPEVHHGKLLPWAALIAYTIAGREAACGVSGAIYFLSGVAKLRGGLARWLAPGNLAMLFAERSAAGPVTIMKLRLWAATTPALCTALAATSLLIELGGIAFLFPRARKPFAIAVTAMHLGIVLLMGYVYVNWILVVVALAFLPLEPAENES